MIAGVMRYETVETVDREAREVPSEEMRLLPPLNQSMSLSKYSPRFRLWLSSVRSMNFFRSMRTRALGWLGVFEHGR